MAELRMIAGEPAALVIESKGKNRGRRNLLVADLHIGIESSLGTEKMAMDAIGRLIERLKALVKENKADRLVLIGDIRHRIPIEKEYWQQLTEEEETERRIALEVPEQLLKLKNECEVLLVPGNHDGALKSYFETHQELMIEDIGIFHSHRWPSEEMIKSAGTVIAAHSHPAVALQDELGHITKRKVWVFGEIDEKGLKSQYPELDLEGGKRIVIMPAFNDLITGKAVNEKREFLGPLLRTDMFKIEKMEVFTLEGTSIEIDFSAQITRSKRKHQKSIKSRGREHGKRKNHTGKVQRLRP